jgi:hypothetical protein
MCQASVRRGHIQRWDSCNEGTHAGMGHMQGWDTCRHGTNAGMGHMQRWDRCRDGSHAGVVTCKGGTHAEVGHMQGWDTCRLRWDTCRDGTHAGMGHVHGSDTCMDGTRAWCRDGTHARCISQQSDSSASKARAEKQHRMTPPTQMTSQTLATERGWNVRPVHPPSLCSILPRLKRTGSVSSRCSWAARS